MNARRYPVTPPRRDHPRIHLRYGDQRRESLRDIQAQLYTSERRQTYASFEVRERLTDVYDMLDRRTRYFVFGVVSVASTLFMVCYAFSPFLLELAERLRGCRL